MSKYKLIVEYYKKGNNQKQIATLCSCSRMTVWRVLSRFQSLEIAIVDVLEMSETDLHIYCFPKGRKQGPDI